VPYSSPMFDVPDVSRFYRCSITDVHIGRSLSSTACWQARQVCRVISCIVLTLLY